MANIKGSDIAKFLTSILLCQLAGIMGSFFTTPAIPTWYAALNKPFFNPPGWVFAPVWITLYLIMGVSLFLVWRRGLADRRSRGAVLLFAIQLILNASWSPAFFGLRSPIAGLVVIIALWAAILLTLLHFLRVSRPAGLLLIPYIAWVSYAVVLNFSIVLLNR